MLKRLLLPALVLAVLALGLAPLVRALRLRLAAGDIYPPYSSLRADPLGARALHDALAGLPGREVRRRLDPLAPSAGGVRLLAGLPAGELAGLGDAALEELDAFLRAGGRLVLALRPEPRRTRRTWLAEHQLTNAPVLPGTGGPAGVRWKFRLAWQDLPAPADDGPPADFAQRTTNAPAALPAQLAWRSGRTLVPEDDAWRVLYARGDAAVLAARRVGAGELVVLTDAFPLANEAQRRARETALLAWLVGGAAVVEFDEVALGVAQTPGVAGLARRYRLHGLAAGLLLLAALFVWRAARPLAPPEAEPPPDAAVRGGDAATGLARLFQRHVPAADLPRTSLEEWRRAVLAHRPECAELAARLAARVEADAARPFHLRDPLGTLAAMHADADAGPRRRAGGAPGDFPASA
jgi:hypothetical protein